MKLLLGLLLALSLPGATLVRIQCGGPGGIDSQGNVWQADTGFTGGARWDSSNQAAMAALAPPYNTLRYSAYPAGSPFSYVIATLPPTTTAVHYTVTLRFVEPNKTAAGQRVFSITANGTPLVTNLDLFAVAPVPGALTPYTVSFPVVITGSSLQLVFTPSVGNAVVSGIQVDSMDAPPPPASSSLNSCQTGIGLGGSSPSTLSPPVPIPSPPLAGTYQKAFCLNDGGTPRTVTSIRCYADNTVPPGASTLDVASGQTGVSFLSAPVICSPSWASGALGQTVVLQAGDWLNFTFASDGATVQTTWVVTEQVSPPPTAASCSRGTTDYTAVTGRTPSREVTIETLVPGTFRPFSILLSETQKFVSTSGLSVSMGRPGPSTDAEMTGSPFLLGVSSGDVNYFSARPIPPQLTDSYSVVLNFTATPPNNVNATAGLLTWEICGVDSVIAAPVGSLKQCQGGNCNGLLWATFLLADNSLLQMVGAPMPGFQATPGTTWTAKN